ncbi:hypothetical protein [Pseudofrankia asymbiotica]|uniref:Uncharacterized protein n=1 Tax=Pseudofrankia asymbiotica TaxID=1834516 RepID=A0A1V2ID15_9ACTN|nr:hypothetical protein [Pseudofrankia asymbiotica]ONH31064.1 hypothetical protein BL253_11060 [Pseudofrankia asymbiotica]
MDNLSVIAGARGERPRPPGSTTVPVTMNRRTTTRDVATSTTRTDGAHAAAGTDAPVPTRPRERTLATSDADANAEAPTITIALPVPRRDESPRSSRMKGRPAPADGPDTGRAWDPRRRPRARDGATAAPHAASAAAASGSARATSDPLGGRVERLLRERLGVTLRAPGRGGRIFLTMTGGAVILIALGSVVLGIGGGPAALRPLTPVTTTAPAAATAEPRQPVNEVAGTPITATRTYLLTSYAPGRGHPSRVEASPRELPVGRRYQHLPRRGDDHMSVAEVVFPLLPAPAACVSRVELRLTLLATEGEPRDEGPYPLAAYPSALTGLAAGKVPATVPTLDLVANRPRGSLDWTRYDDTQPAGDQTATGQAGGDLAAAGQPASDGATTGQPTVGGLAAADQPAGGDATRKAPPAGPREVRADVTELYLRWVAGMPTAQGEISVPLGTPLVLAVRPAFTNILGTWLHTYGGSDTSAPPRLVWNRLIHCSPRPAAPSPPVAPSPRVD